MKNPQDYKWSIEYNANTKHFLVTGFVWVKDRWSRDGATLVFPSLNDALFSIKGSEVHTSRTT